jgi:AcrR family transcriptional regulator
MVPARRALGRPRQVEDDVVFRALLRTLARLGFSHLSFAAVAAEVGVSASALHQRFGSKDGLLRAFLDWQNARAQKAVLARSHSGRPPLEALSGVLGDWLSAFGPVQGGRVVSLWSEVAAYPALQEPIGARIGLLLHEVESLLAAAVQAGDLTTCDTPHLAHVLLAAVAGTCMLYWLTQSGGSLKEQVSVCVETVLAPYRP